MLDVSAVWTSKHLCKHVAMNLLYARPAKWLSQIHLNTPRDRELTIYFSSSFWLQSCFLCKVHRDLPLTPSHWP